MKRFIFFSFSLLFLYSCQQTELQFSCDPVIDAYVAENKEELALLTIQEVTVYELQLQRAIFASWSAEKKRNAWLEKLQNVLENEPLTEAETRHVQALVEHLVPGYFEEYSIEQEKDSRYAFAQEWIRYAATELGWPDRYIGFMVYRLYTSPAQLEAEISELEELRAAVSSSSEDPCGCNTSEDFCGYRTCQSADCNTSSTGCGWFGMYSCNGYCS